jgi:outer membrane lipoprotein SlyB
MKVITILFVALTLVACNAPSKLDGQTYSREDARTPQSVMFGRIVDLRAVNIEGTKSSIGGATGSAIGGIIGSTAGGGKHADKIGSVGAVVGAVLGGLIGSYTEEGMMAVKGVEITVEQKDGVIKSYVQEAEPNQVFRVGDNVRIAYLNGNYRVTPVSTSY